MADPPRPSPHGSPPPLTRREALRRMAAGAAGVGALGLGGMAGACGPAPASGASRSLGPLGVQLYTVREAMADDVAGTLARVAEIGYREVEFAGYFDHSPAEIRGMLDAAGLTAPSAHVPVSAITERWPATLEAAAEIGHGWLVVPSLPASMRDSVDALRSTAELFERAGEEARAAGLRFGFHNHGVELQPVDGVVPLELLCDETDPGLVDFQVDLFWVVDGGGDPLAFFERCAGRISTVHVKDRTADGRMVAVGDGVIDWAALFARREQAGIRHFFVEHDRPDDPFASIEASYRYLSALEF